MPLSLETRHPDLYDGALAAHEASWQAYGDGVERELASTALSDAANPVNRLAQVTAARRRAGELPGQSGLDVILDPETRTRFKEDYAAYEGIFKGGGIAMPTPEELSRGGIDWARLAELKETHPNHNLVVAPLTLPLEQLRQIVSGVTKDSTIPDNPLKKHETTATDSDGLGVNEYIVNAWSRIMQNTKSRWKLPVVGTELQWTAFLLPSSLEPDNLKIPHTQMTQQGITTTPVVGYLAYQMRRIVKGQPPVDPRASTWAAGEFVSSGGLIVPTVRWNAASGQVCVGSHGISYRGFTLGVRPPMG